VVQATEVKNQSICSRRGESCILLQVKLLPLIGSSIKSSLLIILLKIRESLKLPPGLFLLASDSIEVKVSNKQPKIIIPNIEIKEPVDKEISSRLPARAINHYQSPAAKIMGRNDREPDSKVLLFQCDYIEIRRNPANQNSTRSPN
jgi:hypothetical protein